jgi:hypothetical protein
MGMKRNIYLCQDSFNEYSLLPAWSRNYFHQHRCGRLEVGTQDPTVCMDTFVMHVDSFFLAREVGI